MLKLGACGLGLRVQDLVFGILGLRVWGEYSRGRSVEGLQCETVTPACDPRNVSPINRETPKPKHSLGLQITLSSMRDSLGFTDSGFSGLAFT